MADIPVNQNAVTHDQMALRRRARRRLVGAVAIALIAIVALPMLFDPEPKPLGPEVDIRIPDRDSPFEPGVAARGVATDTEVAPPQPAQPSPVATQPPSEPEVKAPSNAEPPAPAPAAKVEQKIVQKVVQKTAPVSSEKKPEAKPAQSSPPTPPAPTETAKASPAGKGYLLQLGVFGKAEYAKKLQAKLQAAGFRASITEVNGQYRVRIGPIADHDKALDYQSQLKAKGFTPMSAPIAIGQ